MTSTLLSSTTYSPVSGSLFDAFKLIVLPSNVKKTINDMTEVFGKKVPNHVELVDSMQDTTVRNFFDTLDANGMSILVFETTKISEEVNGRTKTRFAISDVPLSLGNGTKCVSLMGFHNRNGHAHYEVLMTAPYLKNSFSVIDNPDANRSVRILSMPSNYFEQLRAEKFPVVLKQTDVTKLVSVSQASNVYTAKPISSTLSSQHVNKDANTNVQMATNTRKAPTVATAKLSFAQIVKVTTEPIQRVITSNDTSDETTNEVTSKEIIDFGPFFKESKSKQRKSKSLNANA